MELIKKEFKDYDGIICKHYIFGTHMCLIDNSFCTYGRPMMLKHCSNNKYEPFFLPNGISELYDW